jgi:hypothetical protein
MEFSEPFELKNLTNSHFLNSSLNTYSSSKTSSSNPRHYKNLFQSNQIISESLGSYSKASSCLQIEKDLSYLTEKSHNPRSSLTISLFQPVEPVKLGENSLLIKIYFFNSVHSLDLVLPCEIKVVDMISKALRKYVEHFKSSIPFGLDTSAYKVWLPHEDSHTPDTDFVINKDLQVFKLGCSILCLCENPDFVERSRKTIEKFRVLQKKDKIVLQVSFEGNWGSFLVNKSTELKELLPFFRKKFGISGWVAEELYEFLTFIEETGEYCLVHVGILAKDIRNNQIWMRKKRFLDHPICSNNLIKYTKPLTH